MASPPDLVVIVPGPWPGSSELVAATRDSAFVSLAPMPDGTCYCSTGMQAMNLPDAAPPPNLSPERASEVLGAFLIHCFDNATNLGQDRMFRPRDTQRFRMRLLECTHFPPGHPQHNPHGLWRLR